MRCDAILIASSFVFRFTFCDRNHIPRAHAYLQVFSYWPTIQNSISEICPKIQVLSSQLFRSGWAALWRMGKKCAKRKYFDPHLCPQRTSALIKICGHEYWYILSGLGFQLKLSENENPARKNCFKVARYDKSFIPFFPFPCRSIRTHGSVDKASRSAPGNMASIPAECWNSSPPIGHFAWYWACQCSDTRAFILLRSL